MTGSGRVGSRKKWPTSNCGLYSSYSVTLACLLTRTQQLTVNANKLFNLDDESLSVGREIWELTHMFSATVPAGQTTVFHVDLGELLMTRWTHTTITRSHRLSLSQSDNSIHFKQFTTNSDTCITTCLLSEKQHRMCKTLFLVHPILTSFRPSTTTVVPHVRNALCSCWKVRTL